MAAVSTSIHRAAEKRSSRKLEGPRAQEEEGVWCNRFGFALVQSFRSGVEAKNFVLYVGTWGEGSQWCDRLPFNGGGPSGGRAKHTPAEVRILPPPLLYLRLMLPCLYSLDCR